MSGSWTLESDPVTGNLYVGKAGEKEGSYFTTTSGMVVGDDAGRYFHYYSDVWKKYGVSRFRLSDETKIPKDAEFIALVPVEATETDASNAKKSIFTAFDTNQNVLMTIACNIKGQDTKLFLASDATEGINTLKRADLRNTVTGGIVDECFYLPWLSSLDSSAFPTS